MPPTGHPRVAYPAPHLPHGGVAYAGPAAHSSLVCNCVPGGGAQYCRPRPCRKLRSLLSASCGAAGALLCLSPKYSSPGCCSEYSATVRSSLPKYSSPESSSPEAKVLGHSTPHLEPLKGPAVSSRSSVSLQQPDDAQGCLSSPASPAAVLSQFYHHWRSPSEDSRQSTPRRVLPSQSPPQSAAQSTLPPKYSLCQSTLPHSLCQSTLPLGALKRTGSLPSGFSLSPTARQCTSVVPLQKCQVSSKFYHHWRRSPWEESPVVFHHGRSPSGRLSPLPQESVRSSFTTHDTSSPLREVSNCPSIGINSYRGPVSHQF